MRSFSTVATALVVSASSSHGLVTLLLDSVTYPAIADHHCIAALCSGLGFTSRNGGFHYAASTAYISERRKAAGCQSTVTCASNMICDSVCFFGSTEDTIIAHDMTYQIPYPETFDGGLSCFAQEWTQSGRPMDYLYSKATHKCVPSAQQAGETETALYSSKSNLLTHLIFLIF